ncbi:MAG: hypothetical protein IJW24_03790, partial [Clostridia bacterium]|nr:hypothetical protein [Clostridia bacterium]
MNLELNIINFSNSLRFAKANNIHDLITQIKFIVDALKQDKKEISISLLDNILAKYKKVLTSQEFETLKNGIFVIKVYLYLEYNKNDLNSFLEDCYKLTHKCEKSKRVFKKKLKNPYFVLFYIQKYIERNIT